VRSVVGAGGDPQVVAGFAPGRVRGGVSVTDRAQVALPVPGLDANLVGGVLAGCAVPTGAAPPGGRIYPADGALGRLSLARSVRSVGLRAIFLCVTASSPGLPRPPGHPAAQLLRQGGDLPPNLHYPNGVAEIQDRQGQTTGSAGPGPGSSLIRGPCKHEQIVYR